MAVILHANWNDGALRLWAESHEAYVTMAADAAGGASSRSHPFLCLPADVAALLQSLKLLNGSFTPEPAELSLRLPRDRHGPMPSERLAGLLGSPELPDNLWLDEFHIACLTVPNDQALAMLLRIEDHGTTDALQLGYSLRYWIAVARFVLELLADQRFIPTLYRARGENLRAAWQPWLHDDGIRSRVGALIAAMPPVCRAIADEARSHPWVILSEALQKLTDATVRKALIDERFVEALEDLDASEDAHVMWLAGLLDHGDEVEQVKRTDTDLLRDAGQWVGRLDEGGRGRPLRLCLMLHEPIESAMLVDNEPVPDELRWRLSLHLQSTENPERMIDAEQLWAQPAAGQVVGGQSVDHPQELLLAELGRAGRIYHRIEDALSEVAPTAISLTTKEAYEFLCEHTPVLKEAGFSVIVPQWWAEPASRLGARLQIESTPDEFDASRNGEAAAGPQTARSTLGLSALVQYRWQIAVGDQPLSMEEFQRLANQSSPLVRVQGRWVEIRPDDMQAAVSFLEERPGGEMSLLEAIQAAYGADGSQTGLPVTGLDATGWVARLLNATQSDQSVPMLEQPQTFHGTLRPYQKTGLSWMSFLDRFGLGACLADDMGLGKTIQLIALLLHERELLPTGGVGPTLLIVPTSVVSNWVRELQRFAPSITVHVQHGPDRPMNSDFSRIASEIDVVITTYALVSRDRETLTQLQWHRVVLDEAQYIKNPPTKQTAAIRALKADRRLALTGTPVENRLTELWSIMEFCNPGYLGGPQEFRSRFAVPIERHRDQSRAEALRHLVRPFVLRRLKTDPKVISDLPPLVQTKEFATLSTEQAAAYERTVSEMLNVVDSAEGIQRRGLVLATLVKLKQICNFPEQVLRANPGGTKMTSESMLADGVVMAGLSRRSGKTQRLIALLEEALAGDGKALIFTQFRQMGHLLTLMLRHELDCDALFLHGGTPQAKRQQMIDKFQSPQGAPVFVLSLKAGGLGLNLTAANHVFHFDRWWNPAVENQATDRAFRIGQKRKVHVHKFVCVGTLEERIDQMIEQKMELAENIIGAGEQWITELSTSQLQDLLTLRRSAAMEVDG